MDNLMRVLVTGHNGYVGSVMVDVLAAAGHDVVGLDTYYYEDCTLGAERAQVRAVRADVRHVRPAHLEGFDAVIHLASLPEDPSGHVDRNVVCDINHFASVRLARAARDAGVRRFLFASCASVYRGDDSGSVTEEASLAPLTAHAESKLRVERDVSRLATQGFSPVFLRSVAAYGLSPRFRADLIVNRLLGHACTTGNIPVQGHGRVWQPVVHVEDIARAFLAALEAPRDLIHNRAFNVGRTRENYQIRDIATMICEVVPGSRTTYELEAPVSAGYRVNCDELAWMLPAFRPRWTLREGIRELYDAYRRHGLTDAALSAAESKYVRINPLRRLRSLGLVDDQLHRTDAVNTSILEALTAVGGDVPSVRS
jgi:nucleoside-diphosphate-sugar epimerase